MPSATIKKPLIGKFAKTLDISQAEIGKLRLSDTAAPAFDLMDLAGIITWANPGTTVVSSTGEKVASYTIPNNKRVRLIGVYAYSTGGTWTSNYAWIGVIAASTGGAEEARITTNAIDINTVKFGVQPQPFILNPGDIVQLTVNVSAYTSSGNIMCKFLFMTWDV